MSEWNKNCEYGRTDCKPCTHCDAYIPTWTNADRIRAMSDEELAVFMLDETEQNFYYCEDCEFYRLHAPHCCAGDTRSGCIKARVNWLQQPCECVQERATSCKGGADRECS